MIKVTSSGLRDRLWQLDELQREQLPFAAALALTTTAQEVVKALQAEMSNVFDRPTRATLNSLFIQPATKAKMEARVWINDGGVSDYRRAESARTNSPQSKWTASGTAIKWLAPEVYGGPRDHKGFEQMLQRKGVLAPGQYVMPGKGAPLDRFGNIKRGDITKMLSGARLMTEEGWDANRTNSRRSQAKGNKRYFLIKRGARPIGIAERLGYGKGSRNNIRIVLAFGRKPTYKRLLDFHGVAERTAADLLPIEFEKAMARALATRRR